MRSATIAALLAFAACGPASSDSRDARCDDMSAARKFLTWNVAAGPGMVPLAGPRSEAVLRAMKDATFDVACLQEVWGADHALVIREALELSPYQTFYDDTADLRESGSDVCDVDQLDVISECATKKCGKEPTPEVSICVRKKCRSQLVAVYSRPSGPECINCLVAMAGKSVAEIKRVCISEGASRIQGGASSAMLIAKTGRLYGKEPLLLPSSSSNRTALFATVRLDNADGSKLDVEIACTHLASAAKIPPSHSGYSTWDEEKIGQLQLITQRLAERVLRKDRPPVPAVLMGDLNAGPDASPEVWSVVDAIGFVCPTSDPMTGAGCSSCGDNTLVEGDTEASIDHVCFLNPPEGPALAASCTDRLFDEPVEITGYEGEKIDSHASDHYAKRVLVDISMRTLSK